MQIYNTPFTPAKALASQPRTLFGAKKPAYDEYVFGGTPGKIDKVPAAYKNLFVSRLSDLTYDIFSRGKYSVEPKSGNWLKGIRIGENPGYRAILKNGEVLIKPVNKDASDVQYLKVKTRRHAYIYNVHFELVLKDGTGFRFKETGYWDSLSTASREYLKGLGTQAKHKQRADKAQQAEAKAEAAKKKALEKAGNFDVDKLKNFKF